MGKASTATSRRVRPNISWIRRPVQGIGGAMEPGFLHVGWRELLAVALATVIIVDWAAIRYLSARRGRRADP